MARGPQEDLRWGMHSGPEKELPVLTFTQFTGAIEFVSEMQDRLNQLSH